MALLQIKQVQVEAPRNGRKLLSGISCELNHAEVLSIIGPNGAGKSTLLKCIAGDMEISAGLIDYSCLADGGRQRACQVAVLPQFSLLNFPFRVEEVVQLGRTPHSTGHITDRIVVQQCLAAMDISELAKRHYTTLSGGEKQRVQLARVIAQIWRSDEAGQPPALAHEPRLLLLDEPTTALDLGHQQILMQMLHQLTRQNVAIIMVLHDINLAARHSNHILALRDGNCMAYGSPTEVLIASTIESLFDTHVSVLQHPQDNSPVVVNV